MTEDDWPGPRDPVAVEIAVGLLYGVLRDWSMALVRLLEPNDLLVL